MIFGWQKISCVAMVLEVATARRTFVWREVWPAQFRAPWVHARFFEAVRFLDHGPPKSTFLEVF